MDCKSSSAWCRWALWFPQTTTKDPCVGYCLGRNLLAERSLKCIFTLSLILLSKWLHYASPDIFWPYLSQEDPSSGRAFYVCLKMHPIYNSVHCSRQSTFCQTLCLPTPALSCIHLGTYFLVFSVFSFTEPQIIIELGMIKDRPVNKIKENKNKNTTGLYISQNAPLP